MVARTRARQRRRIPKIALALNQQTNGTLVIDAQGRLVDERVEGPDRQPSLEELRQIATQLAP